MKKQKVFTLADLKDYTKHGNICLVYIRRLRKKLDEGRKKILFRKGSKLFDGVLNYLIKAKSCMRRIQRLYTHELHRIISPEY